jgi:catechol 2,3-dioxygenase-like lactoylglutathione lyase family enzyme
MGKIAGIHHLCVNTPDIDKSLRFYREKLGFELLDRETCAFGEYAMLRLGTSNLELIQPNDPGEDSFGSRGALAHFGLQVEGIDEAFASLKEKGVEFLSGVEEYSEPMGDFRAASFTGPSGEAINLYEFKRAF